MVKWKAPSKDKENTSLEKEKKVGVFFFYLIVMQTGR